MQAGRLVAVLGIGTMLAVTGCGDGGGDESCVSEGAADVCAIWSDIVVIIEASGLEPGSELRVKDFDGIDQGFEIGDDGMPLDPILTYRRPESGRATFDVSGTSGDGDAFEGQLVASGPTS